MKVLIAGCGWLGSALGESLLAAGHRVIGIRRSPEGLDALARRGIEPLGVDLAAGDAVQSLPADCDAVVACQAAAGPTAEDYRAAYLDATANLLAHAAGRPGTRLVYVGSTGVFGQTDGGWVDERTAVHPLHETAEILVEAERRVRAAAAAGSAACVVRLSGLYGPGRFGVVERVRAGRLGLGPGDERWTNWCHLADAVATLRAALERGRAGATYHASDARPLRRADVVMWVAGRLGLDPPSAVAATGGPSGRRAANRRVSARRSREELGLRLAHPDLFSGLAPLFRD
jgi:nucleoside-diphosphate-sugar epimerase